MNEFKNEYNQYVLEVENGLQEAVDGFSMKSEKLKGSMSYSLLLGGKRIRPVILLAMAKALGVSKDRALPYAVALEMIHTHSLIHDDLPALDNDGLRRGKPSNHVIYGEAMAILGGDALLNHAYSLLFNESIKGNNEAKAAKYMCDCTGDDGMLAGQAIDIESENSKTQSEELLLRIYENKTGKLLECPFCVPSLLSGGLYFNELKELGDLIGYLFQLTDDVLDVVGDASNMGKTLGKDEEEGKLTAVSIYGLDGAKRRVEESKKKAKEQLNKIPLNLQFFDKLVDFISDRTN